MVNFVLIFEIIINFIIFLLLIAILYYVFRIRFLTKGFREVWTCVMFGFLFTILSICSKFAVLFIGEGNIASILNDFIFPILLLLSSLFFALGFHRLDSIFNEVSSNKVFPFLKSKTAFHS